MQGPDRRAFLKRLAKTAVYTAPVIHSLAAPVDLLGAAVQATGKKPPGHQGPGQAAPTREGAIGGAPPWQEPPPGGMRP